MQKVILFVFIQLSFIVNGCPVRSYINENGECKKCPSGFYCPDGKNKFICPDNTFTNEWEKQCHPCGCDGCIKADIKNETTGKIIRYGGSCPIEGTCYPGYGYDEETKICKLCEAGDYSIGGWMDCEPCIDNTISRTSGQTKCEECPHQEEPTDKHTRCAKCQPGEYYSEKENTCLMCGENMISVEEGSTECISCGENMHANRERTKCLPGAPKKFTGRYDFVKPGKDPISLLRERENNEYVDQIFAEHKRKLLEEQSKKNEK